MFGLTLSRTWCGVVGLVLLSSSGVTAQTTAIAGTVIDISGAAIPAADLKGQTADGRTIDVVADSSGNFAFQVRVTKITAASAGFAPETVNVGENAAGPITIVLRPSNF